jgi:hypothetical protein
VDAAQVRLKVLSIIERWHRNIIWRVQYRLRNGEIKCAWFKREQAARDWAKMLANAEVVEVDYTVRECRKFGFVDDEIRLVVNP